MPYTPSYSNFFNSTFFSSAAYTSSLLNKTTGNGGPQSSAGIWSSGNATGTSNTVYGTGSYNQNLVPRRGEIADAVSGQLSMFLNSSYTVMTALDSGANWGSLTNATVVGYGTTITTHTSQINTNTSNITANTSSITSLTNAQNTLTTRVSNLETTVSGLTSTSATSGGIRVKP